MLNQPIWLRDLAAYSLQVAAVVLAGSLLPLLLRLRLPRARLAYWQALLGVCLLLPVIQPWHPDLPRADDAGLTGHAGITLGPALIASAGWSLAETVLLILAAGVLLRISWVVLGMRRLRTYRRQAHPLGEFTGPIQEALGRVPARPSFYVSDDLESPATFGLRKPSILLPERFFALPPSMQKAIACHELLHVERRDWAWNMAEEFILALLWFHPAVWWVVRSICLSREQAVDAEVVRLTESRKAYLGALLEMAKRESTPRSVPAPLFLREGQLAQRVALMVKEVSMSRPRLIATLLAAAAALLLTGWASARTFPLKTPPPPAASEEAEMAASTGSAALSTQAYEPHQVDVKKLKRVHIVMPHYPPSAKRAKIQGTVLLEVTVDSKGDVTNICVISGPPELVKPSVDAVKQWRYAPSPLLPARTKVTINFTLRDDPPAQSAAQPKAAPEGNPSAKPADRKVYEIGGNVRAPKPVYDPDPPYTHKARKAGLQGTVVMAVVVNTEGKVESVKEVSKLLGMGMDESAINTIRTWKFQPATRNGKPAPVKITIKCTFRLFGKKKPDPATAS